MICGAGVFVAAYNWIEPLVVGLGDYGKITIPSVTGAPAWVFISILVAVAALTFSVVELWQRGTHAWSNMKRPSGRTHRPTVG